MSKLAFALALCFATALGTANGLLFLSWLLAITCIMSIRLATTNSAQRGAHESACEGKACHAIEALNFGQLCGRGGFRRSSLLVLALDALLVLCGPRSLEPLPVVTTLGTLEPRRTCLAEPRCLRNLT
jgi:hypothetical protein